MNIDEAIKLRNEGKLTESNKLFLELIRCYPDDAFINYQCAWSFDILELEVEAIEYYEKAIKLGLTDDNLREAYLGLGSTYRSIGNYIKAKEVLELAMENFKDKSLELFYAMVLYNLNNYSESTRILMKLLAETSDDESIKRYKRAIMFYSDKLDMKF